VGNQEEINMGGIVSIQFPVALFNVSASLMHAAVHSKSDVIRFNDKTGAGDFSGRSEKFNFHDESFMFSCIQKNR